MTSPLTRARDTAAAPGPPVTVDDRWTEIDYGIYDGLGWRPSPELFGGVGAVTSSYVPEGGESLAHVGAPGAGRLRGPLARSGRAATWWSSRTSRRSRRPWPGRSGVGDETSWRMFVDVASLTRVGAGRRDDRDGSGTEGVPVPSLRTFNETCYRPSI